MMMDRIKEWIAKSGQWLKEEFASKEYNYLMYIVIIILLNLVISTMNFRTDITKNNVYSLSEVSREVVSSLEEPLTVKVFFSENLPAPYNGVSRYLGDLLEEYDNYGNRNFRYEFIDVEDNKDTASDFGISPVQIRELEDDQVKLRNAYMGVAMVHGDLIEKIDSITEPEGLEYRLTTLMNKMNGKIDALLKLDGQINVTLYTSSNMPLPGMQNLKERVYQEVQKCDLRNYNRLKFRYVDTVEDNKALDMADVYGLPMLEWKRFTAMDGSTIPAGKGMVGLVVEHQDRFETVQVLSRNLGGQYAIGDLEGLEDRINGAVDSLVSVNPRVGYIVGHGESNLKDERNGAKQLKEMLSDMYELIEIDLENSDIPQDISTIIINGPKDAFSDESLFKIDQYLMSGRNALILVDSFTEIQQGGNPMMRQQQPLVIPLKTGLNKLISHYGVKVNSDIVMDMNCFETQQRGLGELKLYFAPLINDEGLSDENDITAFLKRMVFLKGSSLTVQEDILRENDISHTVLVKSSDESWLQKGRISFMPFGIRPPEKSQMNSFNLAVLLEGKFLSYFSGENTKGTTGMQQGQITGGIIKKAARPARIFVAGSSEIAGRNTIDPEGKRPNSIFMHNVVDYLSGNYNIPEMRSKGLSFNPIEETGDTTRFILKLVNIAGLPLLVILAGFINWRVRTIRKKRIAQQFTEEGRV